MKKINIKYSRKHIFSGFHILPMLILNLYYQNLTFAFLVWVVKFQYNSYKWECYNCGEICKNYEDASNHCLENSF